MELAAKNYIFTPFGCLFWAMYNINHGPFEFQITFKEKKSYNHQIYLNIQVFIYLQKYKKYPGHPQSPLFTLLPPPPIDLYEKGPQQTK